MSSNPPANWNILAAGSDQNALTPVADQVWPSVFTVGPDFNPVLNTALVQSATETSQNPETVVYKINPKATWSDGVAVTGADFVYNWQAQSGGGGVSDTGGQGFTPAATFGYADVKSVSVTAASPDVVTVAFSAPDPDWTSLFRHLIPAHVAQRVGFDTGFTDPVADLVSDGPYVVTSYDPSGVVHLVRNPLYPGVPAAALELDIHYLPDADQLVAALAAGQLSCGKVPATAGALSRLKSAGNLTVDVAPGSRYIDLVFNAGSGPMRSADTRAAATRAITRPIVIAQALAGVSPQAPPVSNRFLVPGQAGFSPNASPPPSNGKSSPTSSPTTVAIRLVVSAPDSVAESVSQLVAQQLDAAGFQVQLSTAAPAPGGWDVALVERQITPWPSQAIKAYNSGDPANLGGISDGALDAAVAAAAATPSSQYPALVDQVDIAAWQAFADLPVVALPQVLACQSKVTGTADNGSPDGPAFDASGWGLSGG